MAARPAAVQQQASEVRPSRWQRRMGSRQEVADYLGVPVATLTAWAYKSLGPPYKIIGRHARYDWDQVDCWVASQKTGGGAA